YEGRVYTLYFEAEDLRRPSYLGYIDPGNTEHLVCDFASDERETLRAGGGRDAGELCRAVAEGSVRYSAIAEAGDDDPALDVGRRETHVAGRITIDVANTGVATPLALLSYSSGRGRGCEYDYFDVVEDRKIASAGEIHATLIKLQDL